jgi:membrane protein
VERLLAGQIGALLGPRGAAQVTEVLRNASGPDVGGAATVVTVIGFLFGATASFAMLQGALNTAWEVAPDPKRGDVKNFLLKRVISLGMILVVGFLLLVSLTANSLLAAFGGAIERFLPDALSADLLRGVSLTLSLAVATLLFAAIFVYLPDARVRWRHAVLGGLITALLFTGGQWAIGAWIGRSDPGSAYGAAGSVAVLLLWVYYSALIVLLGAEFTQVWSRHRGTPILPERGAARVIRKQERYTGDDVTAEPGAS